jgi:hypothetical protein
MEKRSSRSTQNSKSDLLNVEETLNNLTFSEDLQVTGFKISDELKERLRTLTLRKTEAWTK